MMQGRIWPKAIATFCVALLFTACSTNKFFSEESRSLRILSDDTIQRHASAGPLTIQKARVITANEEAFLSKLEMVTSAQSTIDVAYYIFADDYTSSAFAMELIAAARRGVRVRLLLDYHSAYKDLDLFSMLEQHGNSGSGSLQVRFYNRPTRNIVMDAAYITLRCSDVSSLPGERCKDQKQEKIAAAFGTESVDGRAASELQISNLNIGASGLFLSGLYSKNPELMALAIRQSETSEDEAPTEAEDSPSQEIAISGDDIKGLVKLAGIYWRSRTGNLFQRLVTRIQLGFVAAIYGDAFDTMYNVVAERLPIERRDLAAAVRDWDYVTDYLHQKLILADRRFMQLGGRNMEDTYNLSSGTQEAGQLFMDTDVHAELISGGEAVESAFDRMWNFRTMVASVAEIRRHAPNEFAANAAAIGAARDACADATTDADFCFDREFIARAESREDRQSKRHEEMSQHADHFWKNIHPAMVEQDPTTISIDSGATLYYLENMPFAGDPEGPLEGRTYGARNGAEAHSGKRIHSVALNSMENVCRTATLEKPQRIIINNAYFFPPSNLAVMLAKMLDGRIDCRHVDVTVLTNSIQSTDLAVTNLFARHVAFAFSDHVQAVRDPEKSASFRYFEIQASSGPIKYSLHSKVWVLGDDLLVGSANADVRSYMMDANNAMLIRGAPGMLQQYIANVDQMLADQNFTNDLTDYYLSTPREQAINDDRQAFRGFLKSTGLDGRLTPAQLAEAEERFVGLLDLIYTLTRNGLKGSLATRKAMDRFNSIFKLI